MATKKKAPPAPPKKVGKRAPVKPKGKLKKPPSMGMPGLGGTIGTGTI